MKKEDDIIWKLLISTLNQYKQEIEKIKEEQKEIKWKQDKIIKFIQHQDRQNKAIYETFLTFKRILPRIDKTAQYYYFKELNKWK